MSRTAGCRPRDSTDWSGRGVYYGADAAEASQCAGDDVYIVGAANSAGQAALNIARFARQVVLVVRRRSLTETMSQYLLDRISATANIVVQCESEVVAARGEEHLEAVTHRRPRARASARSGRPPGCSCSSAPRRVRSGSARRWSVTRPASWSPDRNGWGGDADSWPLTRPPYALETSVPGVFAVGDVRLESMKRVASAVGEGAMAVHLLHRYLATT